jgi:Protein of unknown function (DUF1223)
MVRPTHIAVNANNIRAIVAQRMLRLGIKRTVRLTSLVVLTLVRFDAPLPPGDLHIDVEPQASDKNTVAVAIEIRRLPPVPDDDPADLLLAVTEDGLRTEVRRGENQGRTLAHAVVVREMMTVGPVSTAERPARATIHIVSDWRRENVKIVAFVQQRRSRHVLATAVVPLEKDSECGPE